MCVKDCVTREIRQVNKQGVNDELLSEAKKYPISACRKLRKVVVKSGDLLALAVLGILPQQYLCTIKQSARRGGRLKGDLFQKIKKDTLSI